jgi:hypothetical protein
MQQVNAGMENMASCFIYTNEQTAEKMTTGNELNTNNNAFKLTA